MNQDKNIINKVQNDWRSHVIFWIMVLMLAGLFLPRIVLSISTILFILISFIHNRHKEQFQNFIRNPLYIGMSLLFLLPLISGIWSEDKNRWMDVIRTKLPLLLFPLAFAGPIRIGQNRWIRLSWVFLFLVFGATVWSTWQYIQDHKAIEESYLRAKSILTPLEDDHIRFSWMVSVAVLLMAWMIKSHRFTVSRPGKYVLIIFLVWFIVYLHLLSARTANEGIR